MVGVIRSALESNVYGPDTQIHSTVHALFLNASVSTRDELNSGAEDKTQRVGLLGNGSQRLMHHMSGFLTSTHGL
jgi:hypothetical protein